MAECEMNLKLRNRVFAELGGPKACYTDLHLGNRHIGFCRCRNIITVYLWKYKFTIGDRHGSGIRSLKLVWLYALKRPWIFYG